MNFMTEKTFDDCLEFSLNISKTIRNTKLLTSSEHTELLYKTRTTLNNPADVM